MHQCHSRQLTLLLLALSLKPPSNKRNPNLQNSVYFMSRPACSPSTVVCVAGMGAKLTTYYRRKSPADNDHMRLMKGKPSALPRGHIGSLQQTFHNRAMCKDDVPCMWGILQPGIEWQIICSAAGTLLWSTRHLHAVAFTQDTCSCCSCFAWRSCPQIGESVKIPMDTL